MGGYVRDSTLGCESVDIDAVVEGDGIAAARELNKKLKGKITNHPEFGTASISIDGCRVDLASARTERYPSPAQLPRVYPSTIVEDLNRRDFTINAIAMSVSKDNFGEIFDPFEGLSDIKRKLIRILHRNSFVDDPTRIFRALRYKNRFGFKLEEDTERMLREAVDADMIAKLSGQRILNELRLIFAEDNFQATAAEIAQYSIFAVKSSSLKLMPPSKEYAFYFFLSKLPRNTLPLSKDEKKIVDGFREFETLSSRLAKTSKKSVLYALLSPVSEEVVESLALVKPELQEKIRVFRGLARVKPFITGKDLRHYGFKPEKRYAKILRNMRMLQIDKKISNRREAIAYLKTLKKR